MSDLSQFLLARIAEDEEAARKDSADAMVGWRWKHYPREAYEDIQTAMLAHSAHVLAKCKADRLIVEFVGNLAAGDPVHGLAAKGALCYFAVPYADHEQFRKEWRV